MDAQAYDVVVVGGGAAGLSAALVLGRARRRVAVVDAGAPRNAPAAHMQGFLSRDGMPPAELLAAGRAEVDRLRRRAGRRIRSSGIEPGFVVRLAGGRVLTRAADPGRDRCRATSCPDIPGVRERWGRDLLHCPYCHGWEVRDQPLGVLGTLPGSVQHAQLVRQWSDDVVFFAHTYDLTVGRTRCSWRHAAIQVVDGEVARLVVEADRLTGVELTDGRVIARTAVFIRPGNVPHADGLLAGLGCERRRGRLRHRRRHRPDEHVRRLGRRQRRRSARPGDHRRRRRIRGGDRHQRRPGAGRRRAGARGPWPCSLTAFHETQGSSPRRLRSSAAAPSRRVVSTR